jgi:NAD(P)H-nitrite reductase large subunit
MRYVMIGHSYASTFAVEAIRKVDPVGRITVVGDEPHRLYSRAMLHEFMARMVKDDLCWLRRPNWAEQHGVDLITGTSAIRLDPGSHTVQLDDGRLVPYDRLLIACGGKPFVPSGIEGYGQFKQVYHFTRMSDAIDLRTVGDAGGTVVVLGGGLIGLQCAEGLHRLGCQVHVVELADMVLPLAVDRTAADLIARTLTDQGMRLHLSESISRIGGTDGNVGHVVLAGGKTLPCRAVVVAVGMRPNVGWLAGAGIAIDRGILVDEHLRTNRPDVYAAGDCAQGLEKITGKRMILATIPTASRQGLLAGYNMAGVARAYDGEIPLNALQFGSIQVVSYGFVQDEPDSESLSFLDEKNRVYRKVVLKDNRVVGALLLRAIDRAGLYRQLINKRVDVSSIRGRLTAIDFGVGDLPSGIREEMFARSPAVAVAKG